MRFVTFRWQGEPRLGLLDGERVVDLHNAYRALLIQRGHLRPGAAAGAMVPPDMVAFLAGGDESRRAAREAADHALGAGQGQDPDGRPLVHPLAGVRLLAPVLRPGKIICVGLNYRDHILEMGRELPSHPTIFAKFANAIRGPGEPIPRPLQSEAVDYEAELAFIMGRRCRRVSEGRALDHVAGYTIANDVSVRDYQRRTLQWLQGKAFDGALPLGPCLVTGDEVDPSNLDVRLTVNGEERQRSNTGQLVFSVATLVAYLSDIMTLEPGDVVLTGTPGGVGDARTPPAYLKDGDVVRIEIQGIGVLENPVVDEAKL